MNAPAKKTVYVVASDRCTLGAVGDRVDPAIANLGQLVAAGHVERKTV